mmetsp:Transcript_51792/g.159599  ORF Transcript_51792/g.159599 Transcript_51792/m.159599 type:complete len:203 (+) Transcript_51792:274-882(+)
MSRSTFRSSSRPSCSTVSAPRGPGSSRRCRRPRPRCSWKTGGGAGPSSPSSALRATAAAPRAASCWRRRWRRGRTSPLRCTPCTATTARCSTRARRAARRRSTRRCCRSASWKATPCTAWTRPLRPPSPPRPPRASPPGATSSRGSAATTDSVPRGTGNGACCRTSRSRSTSRSSTGPQPRWPRRAPLRDRVLRCRGIQCRS